MKNPRLTKTQLRALKKIRRRLELGEGGGRAGFLARTRTERRVLTELVGVGEIRKISRGIYVTADAPELAVLAHKFNAKVTCTSALEFSGLRTLSKSEEVHLAIPRDSGIRIPQHLRGRVILHRENPAWLALSERSNQFLRTPNGLKQTNLLAPWAAVFARITICQTLQAAVVALDAGISENLIERDDVEHLLRKGHYPSALRVLDFAARSSQSVLESIVRLVLVQAGISVSAQKFITGVGYVDLLIEDWLVIELDGFAYHADREQFRKDRARDRELVKLGYTVLRYAYEHVINNPELVLADVRYFLAKR